MTMEIHGDLHIEFHADEHSGQGDSKMTQHLVWPGPANREGSVHSTEAGVYVLLGFACMGSSGTGGSFTLTLELLPPVCPDASRLLSLLAVNKTSLT